MDKTLECIQINRFVTQNIVERLWPGGAGKKNNINKTTNSR